MIFSRQTSNQRMLSKIITLFSNVKFPNVFKSFKNKGLQFFNKKIILSVLPKLEVPIIITLVFPLDTYNWKLKILHLLFLFGFLNTFMNLNVFFQNS